MYLWMGMAEGVGMERKGAVVVAAAALAIVVLAMMVVVVVTVMIVEVDIVKLIGRVVAWAVVRHEARAHRGRVAHSVHSHCRRLQSEELRPLVGCVPIEVDEHMQPKRADSVRRGHCVTLLAEIDEAVRPRTTPTSVAAPVAVAVVAVVAITIATRVNRACDPLWPHRTIIAAERDCIPEVVGF